MATFPTCSYVKLKPTPVISFEIVFSVNWIRIIQQRAVSLQYCLFLNQTTLWFFMFGACFSLLFQHAGFSPSFSCLSLKLLIPIYIFNSASFS